MAKLAEWYRIHFDDRAVVRDVSPPSGEPWRDEFAWTDVVRVCFRAGTVLESDELYVFTSVRPESYVIPTEADGGAALVGEMVRRRLLPADLLIEAALSVDRLFCWPSIKGANEKTR
jgi:hypothetical protein